MDIIRGSSDKYVVNQQLAEFFESNPSYKGILYLGYPIIGSVEGAVNVDALVVSPDYGVIVFDMVEGIEYSDRSNVRDELYMKVHSKLSDYKALSVKRNLVVDIYVVTYAPGWTCDPEEDVITSDAELQHYLNETTWTNSQYYNLLLQALQGVAQIKATPKRENVKLPDSKGAVLKKLENAIANLDNNQSAAVIETSDSVQRIRGLAGSGKTIVLALKVAYLHAKNPEWNIAVTFQTRALKKQFEDLITRFTYEHKRDKPDWSKIKIIQAWGSSTSNLGIYYEICKRHGIEYLDYNAAKYNFGGDFGAVCKKALDEIKHFETMYDLILVDEAQDLSKHFLRLCYEILSEPKRLIFAYDELQILNNNSMPPAEEIFGEDSNGNPRVVLKNERNKPKQDIILKVCYRNSRPVLATAHSLGFGVYRDGGLVQLFSNKRLWQEVGYEVKAGELADGKYVELGRTAESSPEFLESHSKVDDLLQFQAFNTEVEQDDWIVQEIIKNIQQDELRHQDIMVVHTDPITTQTAVGNIRKKLFDLGVNSHIAGAANPDLFTEEDSVTFTGIYRAKGNEAGMVYVINAQNCFGGLDLSWKRNILFTAITRSKGWVRVAGHGENMLKLTQEFQQIKSNGFSLNFTYPTEEQRKKINIIHRDISKDTRRFIENSIENLSELIRAIQKREVFLEDLPVELRNALKGIFDDE